MHVWFIFKIKNVMIYFTKNAVEWCNILFFIYVVYLEKYTYKFYTSFHELFGYFYQVHFHIKYGPIVMAFKQKYKD